MSKKEARKVTIIGELLAGRGDSNPCPKERPAEFLRAHSAFWDSPSRRPRKDFLKISPIYFPLKPLEKEGLRVPSLCDALH